MKRMCSGGVAALLFVCAAGAQAKPGDAAWAACVWQGDAQAADNWLRLAAPKWQDAYGTPSERLGLRLVAKCDATAADPAKPNRILNWKALRAQLTKARPKGALSSQTNAVGARLCEHFAVKDGARALYLAEAVRVEGGRETVVHQNYFDQAGSGAIKVVDHAGRRVSFTLGGVPSADAPVRMPQATLIASPAEGFTSDKVCRAIGADGALQ